MESLATDDQSACEATIASLKTQEIKCAFPTSSATATQLDSGSVAQVAAASGEEVVSNAQSLLEKLQICLPLADLTPAASSRST